MKNGWRWAGILAMVAAAPAQALVLGGTNLSILGYPEAQCSKPDRPMRPYSASPSRGEIDTYNFAVDRYNSDLQAFTSCTREYIENAQNDVKRIRERMDEAVERAKR